MWKRIKFACRVLWYGVPTIMLRDGTLENIEFKGIDVQCGGRSIIRGRTFIRAGMIETGVNG